MAAEHEIENQPEHLMSGAIGGKGRGLMVLHSLVQNVDFRKQLSNINVKIPKTYFVGADVFTVFMEQNKLHEVVLNENDDNRLKAIFLQARLSPALLQRLKTLILNLHKPLVVRSSGVLEDSLEFPFSGIFESYILPNSASKPEQRLQQLTDAIKMVYASVFSERARGYFTAIKQNVEQEKMAIILQELVGRQFDDNFYPHVSGVAQSYNYYPFGAMQPEDGVATAALGLGSYVAEGHKAYRFSPVHPALQCCALADQIKNSQQNFFAVNLACTHPLLGDREKAALVSLDLATAEKHGSLRHCGSVYNSENKTIYPGLGKPGMRLVNFADILKYNFTPLAQTLKIVLDALKLDLGTAVEMEWALNLDRDARGCCTLYLLQVKTMVNNAQEVVVNRKEISTDELLLFADKSMGNGFLHGIKDVIFIDQEAFDKRFTEAMAYEIEQLNRMMVDQQCPYILIGPGRWGSRDSSIGIPVNWSQINQAQVIVETERDNFPLDASTGSHFFHHLVAMNVGYCTVQSSSAQSFINYQLLEKQHLVRQTKFFKQVRFSSPLIVQMDGKKRVAQIIMERAKSEKGRH